MLLSTCFHQLVGKITHIHRITTRESPCADVIAIQFARMSNQILQDQENVLLKMYDNFIQSAWKHK